MLPEPRPKVLSALQLIRSGRFLEAVAAIESGTQPNGGGGRATDVLSLALLADALQRIGENDRAELLASRIIQAGRSEPSVNARCHFTLGNVFRDRGDTTKAIEHLQIATSLSAADAELSCWSQLRLMVVLSELSGPQIAMARLDEVKRSLTSYGDARPFAALHLWLVEIEGMRGNLESARQHLKTADLLLSAVDDVWLKGYLAINRSAVHYYAAEIAEARRWATSAIEYAQTSGHRATLRAAHTNLGNILSSLGDYSKAEECFELALRCCESGSVHQIAILDNIAQIQLGRGDVDGCRARISTLEKSIERSNHAKRRHYYACALQTKLRLLLAEGKKSQALAVSETIADILTGLPQARVGAERHILKAEALLANDQLCSAADALAPVTSPTIPLSPDLLARFEHVSAQTLVSSGAVDLGRVRLERAIHIYNIVGHCIGSEQSRKDFLNLSERISSTESAIDAGCQRSLDRIRSLMELRTRPELFGYEAAALLEDLGCSCDIQLVIDDEAQANPWVQTRSNHSDSKNSSCTLTLSSESQRKVELSFVPFADPRAKLTALSFSRVISQILSIQTPRAFDDQNLVWTTEGLSATHGNFFGSGAMLAILRTVKQVAPLDVTVLITGETGTGKEVIARAIHEHSRRSSMPFLALNCAAVPKDLLESQLFGHRKGAFSGATENHQGIVRAANGGTLLLDEIGELPMDMQAKLLRFLEMSEVHPVGDSHPVKVNVRLLFATNGDLEEAVKQNRFRQDLFYRINVIPIKVPPLRERREEIPVLANLFAQRFAGEFAKEPVRFSSTAMELLILYSWPGNVRQLANEIRRLTALAESGTNITPDQLSAPLQALASPAGTRGQDSDRARNTQVRIDQSLEQATAHLETEMIRHALRQAGGRMSAAAAALGISRKGLYLKRMRLGITEFGERAH
jgi:DNA-binding NtrC family response regulator/tetratricopeptide (TPR) repeat protein